LGADSYGFVHRTFLEYFCAWEFVWQFKETRELKNIDELIDETFKKHWQDEKWHEVLRLICGMIEPKFVAEIIDYLLEQEIDRSNFLDKDECVTKEGLANIILATNCFAEVRNRNLIITTFEQLLKILKREIEQESQSHFSWELTQTLMSVITANWKEDPNTLSWLKNCALQHENHNVRYMAVEEIAEGWKEDPDTLLFLKDRALQDENEYVRGATVNAIAQGWKEDLDTLPLLKDRALQDENKYVRQAAVNAIAQNWKEDPDTLPWLKDRALQNENYDVRRAVVKAISQNWKEDPDILPLLKDRAL
jgi:predicted NACHT family NTPase